MFPFQTSLLRAPDSLQSVSVIVPQKSGICRALCGDDAGVRERTNTQYWFRSRLPIPLFRDFRLAENRVTKLCLGLASRLDFVIRRCRWAVKRRQGSKRMMNESVCR